VTLAKGEEMGRFNMGSTVIVALPPGGLRWCPGIAPGRPVAMGTGLADLV
jgi:phosphatidylserine decarboxylase